jgi:hypothetical protein
MERCTKREFIQSFAECGDITVLIDHSIIRVVPCTCTLPTCRGWKLEPTEHGFTKEKRFEKECLTCGHIWRDDVPPPDAICPECKATKIADFGLGEGYNEN